MILTREIPIKVTNNYQNAKDLNVYFLLPLTTETFLLLLEEYIDIVSFFSRGLYLPKFKIQILIRPVILLYPRVSPLTVLSDTHKSQQLRKRIHYGTICNS